MTNKTHTDNGSKPTFSAWPQEELTLTDVHPVVAPARRPSITAQREQREQDAQQAQQIAAHESLISKRHNYALQADSQAQKVLKRHNGGVTTVAEAVDEQAKHRAKIDQETEDGSLKHKRLPHAVRMVPKFILVFDAMLLLYFFGGITNVDWANPLGAPLIWAVLLAAVITGVCFGFFTFVGKVVNGHKDHDGNIKWSSFHTVTKLLLGLSLVGFASLAILMFYRMSEEVTQAGTGGGWIIATTLAVVSLLANTLVILVYALDGSEDTGKLDALGRKLYRPLKKAQKLRLKAAQLAPAVEASEYKIQRPTPAPVNQQALSSVAFVRGGPTS